MDPDAYAINYVYNTRKCDKEGIEPVDKLVYFFVVGNKGSVYQFQPIANTLYEYITKVDKYKLRNTCIDSYFFDFKDQPTAFSHALIDQQASYVAAKVNQVVRDKGYTAINFVTHSLGSYVAYKALDLDKFPKDELKNVISLASPNIRAPQEITGDLTVALEEIKKQDLPEHVAYFHFDGGVRDFFVG